METGAFARRGIDVVVVAEWSGAACERADARAFVLRRRADTRAFVGRERPEGRRRRRRCRRRRRRRRHVTRFDGVTCRSVPCVEVLSLCRASPTVSAVGYWGNARPAEG